MSTILSFPDRGPWGKASWRGNCSGHVYMDLYKQLQPKFVVDPMVGSGTSIEVAEEMGIRAVGLDLHKGFNILRDSILEAIGEHADLVHSHPPYGGQVIYSGEVWGSDPHPDDLSRCVDDEDFMEKLQVGLLNQREATIGGGHYATIIGDWRRNGVYTSYQAECIARMPKEELAAVLIKAQHNVRSAARSYRNMRYPLISHEYILIWQKKIACTYHLLYTLCCDQGRRLSGTWRSIVRMVMVELGGQATLAQLYERVSKGCPERIKQNPSWQAKVRQIVNSSGEYVNVRSGEWKLA